MNKCHYQSDADFEDLVMSIPWPPSTSDLATVGEIRSRLAERYLRLVQTVPMRKSEVKVDRSNPWEEIPVAGLGRNLERLFSPDQLFAPNMMPPSVQIYDLIKGAADNLIIESLGGGQLANLSAHCLREMLLQQRSGEPGPLLTDGRLNIAYVLDRSCSYWSVHCYWSAVRSGWYIGAYHSTDPGEWRAGYRILKPILR